MKVKCLAHSRCSVNGSGDAGRSRGRKGKRHHQGRELHPWYGPVEQPTSGRENKTNFLTERAARPLIQLPGVKMGPEAPGQCRELRKAGSREAPEHRNRSCEATRPKVWGCLLEDSL